jgi:hypothetical protein
MAQRIVTIMTDDLDGKEDESVQTVTFGLNGTSYEIDLSKKNREALTKALAPYTEKARRTGKRASTRKSTASAITTEDREWLRKNGFPNVKDRGRLPNDAQEALANR